eukprot:TRINITY_DN9222_c0_g1_i1.p1 TRINITY_DN9222_c0_g1~~TRINITY_DN9222_c0_g1_i1.p1  ORF type:complete len:636 (-),score=155.01 TRINITY_DN9222_c0_g1_i1:196-2103(-)
MDDNINPDDAYAITQMLNLRAIAMSNPNQFAVMVALEKSIRIGPLSLNENGMPDAGVEEVFEVSRQELEKGIRSGKFMRDLYQKFDDEGDDKLVLGFLQNNASCEGLFSTEENESEELALKKVSILRDIFESAGAGDHVIEIILNYIGSDLFSQVFGHLHVILSQFDIEFEHSYEAELMKIQSLFMEQNFEISDECRNTIKRIQTPEIWIYDRWRINYSGFEEYDTPPPIGNFTGFDGLDDVESDDDWKLVAKYRRWLKKCLHDNSINLSEIQWMLNCDTKPEDVELGKRLHDDIREMKWEKIREYLPTMSLEAKTWFNGLDSNYWGTPLYYAVANDAPIDVLRELKKDSSVEYQIFRTPVGYDYIPVFSYGIEFLKGDTPLMRACLNKDLNFEVLKLLMEDLPPLTPFVLQNYKRQSAFHMLVQRNAPLEMIKFFCNPFSNDVLAIFVGEFYGCMDIGMNFLSSWFDDVEKYSNKRVIHYVLDIWFTSQFRKSVATSLRNLDEAVTKAAEVFAEPIVTERNNNNATEVEAVEHLATYFGEENQNQDENENDEFDEDFEDVDFDDVDFNFEDDGLLISKDVAVVTYFDRSLTNYGGRAMSESFAFGYWLMNQPYFGSQWMEEDYYQTLPWIGFYC